MMDGRSEFFVYMGAAIGTSVMLFVAQQVYASYLDVNVAHASWKDAARDEKIELPMPRTRVESLPHGAAITSIGRQPSKNFGSSNSWRGAFSAAISAA